jgi:hypothetical protein
MREGIRLAFHEFPVAAQRALVLQCASLQRSHRWGSGQLPTHRHLAYRLTLNTRYVFPLEKREEIRARRHIAATAIRTAMYNSYRFLVYFGASTTPCAIRNVTARKRTTVIE